MRSIFRSLLLAALAVSSLQARTLTQLKSDTRILTRDASSTTRQRFADSAITELLNQGQREAMARTRCIEKSVQFTLSPGATYYALPTDFNFVRRVTRGSLSLTELSPASIDSRSRGWETATGLPTYYFINFSSRGLIGFTPFPATATDTDTVKVEYFADATDLSAASDVPFNNINELNDYQQMLPYYAAARMSLVDGRLQLAQLYTQIYEMMLKAMGENCKLRPNYLPSAIGTP